MSAQQGRVAGKYTQQDHDTHCDLQSWLLTGLRRNTCCQKVLIKSLSQTYFSILVMMKRRKQSPKYEESNQYTIKVKPCLVSHIRSLKTAALTEEKTRLNKSPKQTGFHFLILCSACFNFSVEQFAQFKKGLRSNTCLGLDCCPVLSMSGAVSHQRGSPQMPGSWDNPRLLFLSRNRKWWDLF